MPTFGSLRPLEVIARIVDGSRFDEYKPLYGSSLVTGWASIHGFPMGSSQRTAACCSGRSPARRPSSSCWPTRCDVPLLFLQNTTGFMVGNGYEQGGHHQGRREDDQRRGQQRLSPI